jgi:hypothetical protein
MRKSGGSKDYGIEMQSPGWVARQHARKDAMAAMAAMYAEEQLVRQEVDRIGILPRPINACLQGTAEDRQQLRDLQKECSRFGGGPEGRGMARPKPPVTAEELLRAFAILSMSDGDGDWRDEKLWLDDLCAVGRASGKRTVDEHTQKATRKLGAITRTQAVVNALRIGEIEL